MPDTIDSNTGFAGMAEVRHRAGDVHRSTIWRWVSAGLFPKPRDLGNGTPAWSRAELAEWERSRPLATGKRKPPP